MKDRLEKLENAMPDSNPGEKIIQIAQYWWDAIHKQRNFDEALKFRQDADSIFEDHPELVNDKPFCRKNIYIDWDWFCYYTDEDVRKHYNQCSINSYSPGRFQSFQKQRENE